MVEDHSGFKLLGNIDGNSDTYKAENMLDPTNAQDYVTKLWAENNLATSPGGNTTEIQYNDTGAFAGDSKFTWDDTLKVVSSTGLAINPTALAADATPAGLTIAAGHGAIVRNIILQNSGPSLRLEAKWKTNPTDPTDITEAGYTDFFGVEMNGDIFVGNNLATRIGTASGGASGGIFDQSIQSAITYTQTNTDINNNRLEVTMFSGEIINDVGLTGVSVFGFASSPKNVSAAGTAAEFGGYLAKIRTTHANNTITHGIGFKIEDATATGTITTQTGFYCPELTAGATNWAFYSDDTASHFADIECDGDLYFTGDGTGIPYGMACDNGALAWQQANAAQNTWYNVSDANIDNGDLNLLTGDGAGLLTVTKAGRYMIQWSISLNGSIANTHYEAGIEINGSGSADTCGQSHFSGFSANADNCLSGIAILDLAATETIEIAVRTTAATTPNLNIEHLNLVVTQVGGT